MLHLLFHFQIQLLEQKQLQFIDGDNTNTIIEPSDTINQALCTHTYLSPGEYIIEIYSTNEYMPYFSFYSNYRTVNNNPKKLINVLTSMHNTRVIGSDSIFNDCTNLISIPSNLFKNNPQKTTFMNCFYLCSSLTSIPEGLFDNNLLVTRFDFCFNGCPSLTSIPEGLFDNNLLVTSFSYCFNNSNNLTLNERIFSSTLDYINRFANKTVNFDYCFNRNGTFTGIQGTAPELWNYTFNYRQNND